MLTADVGGLSNLLVGVFGATAHRVSDDFAIIAFDGALMQIHHDRTYGAHPMLDVLPENPSRGGGAQFFLFGADPDRAVAKAKEFGGTVLEQARDKPHGLREATVLSAEGYAFTAAVAVGKD